MNLEMVSGNTRNRLTCAWCLLQMQWINGSPLTLRLRTSL
jgi:hypothetical protein